MRALDNLERIAARRGWRLRWKADRVTTAPRLTCTELDVFEGRRLLTRSGSVWLIHSQQVDAREMIAGTVMSSLAMAADPPSAAERA